MDNLSNLLSVLIGFATVMLLLSMVVTGLGQALSTSFGLRWRSGHAAVVRFLEEEFSVTQKSALRCADQIFNLPPIDREKPWWNVWWQHIRRLPKNKPPRELGWPELEPAIRAHLTSEGRDIAKIEIAKFDRLRARISDDYSRSMKAVSFAMAFMVAACFQVSATKLVHDLSISDEMRLKALEINQTLVESKETAAATVPFAAQAEQALEEVRKQFPAAAGALEQMSGVSDSREELVTELRNVLKGTPEEDRVIGVFQGALDREGEERVKAAQAAGQAAQVSLSGLDIRFIEDACFYVECAKVPTQTRRILWGNMVGVLMTGILLTFGAPFWYERLKGLNVFQNELRSMMKKEREELEPNRKDIAVDSQVLTGALKSQEAPHGGERQDRTESLRGVEPKLA